MAKFNLPSLSFFKKKNQSLIGIDLSPSKIKMVELLYSGNGFIVQDIAEKEIAPLAITEGKIAQQDIVTNAISSLTLQHKWKKKRGSVALPFNLVYTKMTQYSQQMTEREIEEGITLDAKDLIPFDIDEVSIDFSILGDSDGDNDERDVLLVAAQLEHIDGRRQAVVDAGINLVIVDIETYAIQNIVPLMAQAIEGYTEDMVVAFFDVGPSQMMMYVVHFGKIIFVRDHDIGHHLLVDSISLHYGLSHSDAEEVLHSDTKPEGYYEKIIKPLEETIISTVGRAIQFFLAASINVLDVDAILIGGETDRVPAIIKGVSFNQSTIPVVKADPFISMKAKNARVQEKMDRLGVEMITACGLALRAK